MPIFQVKHDFRSLFRSNSLPTVDGLRALANLSIVFLHVSQLFLLFTPMFPAPEWNAYLQSHSFRCAMMFVNSLEVFFVISGFLLTYAILTNEKDDNTNVGLVILRRLLRYYPGFFMMFLYMRLFGDLERPYAEENKSPIVNYLVHLLLIVNYIKLDYWFHTMRVNWSNCVDFHVYVLLTLLLRYLWVKRKLTLEQIRKVLIGLLLVSVPIGYLSLDTSTELMKLGTRSHPHFQTSYDQTNAFFASYNLTMPIDKSQFVDRYKAKNFIRFYMPTHARYGSFVTGAIMAIKLIESKRGNFANGSKLKKYLYWILTCGLFCIISIRPSLDQPDPPIVLVCAMRQMLSMGVAYLLYTTLVPATSVYHNSFLHRLLSSKFLIPISKLSYLVYLIHLRLAGDLVANGTLRQLKTLPIDIATMLCFPVVLFLSEMLACGWYCLVEQPFLRLTNMLLVTSKRRE